MPLKPEPSPRRDERWEAAQTTDWGTPKDSHPHLFDGCKQKAGAVAQETDRQERPGPLPDWAKQKPLLRCARRPSCTECGAAFTDERWQAVERVGWDTLPPEANPTRCGHCDKHERVGIEQSWIEQG
ncbi:hypothetical protein [Streptomyces sp. NPDC054887]